MNRELLFAFYDLGEVVQCPPGVGVGWPRHIKRRDLGNLWADLILQASAANRPLTIEFNQPGRRPWGNQK